MRGIILALLLTLAGSEKSKNELLLNPSKTYAFNYEGITLSGMPDKGLSKAGLKLNLGAEISGFAQRKFMLKVQQFDIKEYNGQWPRDPFTRSTKRTQAFAEQIKQPFKFEYHDGQGLSRRSVNMNRGILSMFQVQIRKSQNIYDLEELPHDFAAEAANKAHTEEMTIPLKAIGNAGQVSSIKRLMKFLPGLSSSAHQLPIRVQVNAVMALRNIARNDSKRVEENLHSSLKKRSTDTEVRLMPDAVLMEYRPSAAAMITMADAIQKETKVNLQLADFVYSYMNALNQSDSPIKP